MTEYQGHRSWNAWNVSLYISNEEHLYRAGCEALRATRTPGQATRRFFRETGLLETKTPDGAVYNWLSTKLALIGLEIGQDGRAGHDFWLTRCGHGAGFWDGDWPEPQATRLTDAAHKFGNVDLYVGDDGKVHAS